MTLMILRYTFLTVVTSYFYICTISKAAAEWEDPDPFDPASFERRDLLCTSNSDCQNEKYCSGVAGCLKNATCGNDGYCKCPAGRYGWRCQYATCDDYDYCKNDGDCMIVYNKHECACPLTTSGKQCETLLCNEHTCTGNCVNGKCICPSEIKTTESGGEKCKPDCAAWSPCKNGGTCATEKNKYKCTCPPGFHGPHCSKLDCDPTWCVNGLCIEKECVCYPGYSGDKCQTASCQGYLGCFDKGVCSDENNVLKCLCDEKKYAGTYCEFECTKECPENSKCNFDDKCYCNEGFYGEECDKIYTSSSAMSGGFIHFIVVGVMSLLILIIYIKFFQKKRKMKF